MRPLRLLVCLLALLACVHAQTSKPTAASPTVSKPTAASPTVSKPTVLPTPLTTAKPTSSTTSQRPTARPSARPTTMASPTTKPTPPSKSPTSNKPTIAPRTSLPSRSPSRLPSRFPSASPSVAAPSQSPTVSTPSMSPISSLPSATPVQAPTQSPSMTPTTTYPSTSPTFSPSILPSKAPTSSVPSSSPSSSVPSASPSTSRPSSSPISALYSACLYGRQISGFGTFAGNNAQSPTVFSPYCQGLSRNDYFFIWTANATQYILVNTFGTKFDTILSVFDDAYCQHEAKCNDDCCYNSYVSQIAVQVNAGQTYRFAVSGFGNYSMGQFNLTVVPQGPTPAPTPCPKASSVIPTLTNSSSLSTVFGTNVGLPIPAYHPSCQGDIQTAVYYSFTPSFNGTYMIDTAGSNYDTVLSVFGDPYCSNELTCNDDSPVFPPQSMITLFMQANVTYTVVVAAYYLKFGNHVVRVFLASNMMLYPPPNNVTVGRVTHGLCYSGYCDCDIGWIGPTCSQPSSNTPTVSPVTPTVYIPATESFAFSEMGVLIVALSVMIVGGCVCACCSWAFPRYQVGETAEETEGLGGAGEGQVVGSTRGEGDMRPLQPSTTPPAHSEGPEMVGGFLIDEEEEAAPAHSASGHVEEEDEHEHEHEHDSAPSGVGQHQILPDEEDFFSGPGGQGATKMTIV